MYTSTYNVVFGGQEIPNGDETLPYFPLHKVRTGFGPAAFLLSSKVRVSF